MTSQRDETVGHRAGDEIEDDPILVERHDEILGGPPAEDRAADDTSARDELGTDQMATDQMATGRPASDELATDQMASDGPASDELAGRHAAPGTGSTGLDQDPPPLVVPAGPAPADDPAAPGWASTSGAQAAAPAPGVPVTPGSAQAAASTAAASTPAASVGEPAAGPNGDGVPAAALAGQQWPAIQAMFVDDPKGSVERAAAAADEVVKAFVASLQREQAALRSAWEKDTCTEDLRTALQQYRAFCGRLEGLA
jgi:hypothetical protein